MRPIESIVIELTSKCNLSCEYCFINKNNRNFMNELDELLVQALQDDSYIEYVKRDFTEEERKFIRCISLWGGEPTIHLPEFTRKLEAFVDVMPNLDAISFSSNFILSDIVDRLEELIREIERLHEIGKLHERTMLSMQVSIDGIDNDLHRGSGAADIIIKNFQKLVDITFNPKYVFIDVHTHPTYGADTIASFCEEGKIGRNYDFFYENFYIPCRDSRNGKNDAFDYQFHGSNLVEPEMYTVEDGKKAAKAYRAFYEYWRDFDWTKYEKDFAMDIKFGYPGHKPVARFRSVYPHMNGRNWLEHLCAVRQELLHHETVKLHPKYHMLCSAGVNAITYRYDGKITLCHREYFNGFEEYRKSFNSDINNDSFEFNPNYTINESYKALLFSSFKEFDFVRKNIHTLLIEGTSNSYTGYIQDVPLIIAYARAGLIDEKYKEKKEATFAAKYAHGAGECVAAAYDYTGTPYVNDFFSLKFYLNGALDWIEKIELLRTEYGIKELTKNKKVILE